MLHEYFTQRGIRESVQMTSTFPMQRPVPVTGDVSQMFRDALAARSITELPEHLVTSIDPAPDPLPASGLAVNGWVPIDQTNLRTRFAGVYAIVGVCTGRRMVPKAGIFAESAAIVVAADIEATITGGRAT